MAEKTIGLRIELNGFRGVVTNIKQLEDEINKAKQDLKELEIGSPIFKELTREIALAEAKLKGLNEAATAEGYKKGLNNWIAFGAGVSAAFGAATAALSLFSSESEEGSRLAAQAQSALALALSASAIAQLEFGSATLASTIALRAESAAAATTNVTLKALWTTIAANPVGAILVVLGGLVALLSTFKSETKEAVKETKQLGTALYEQRVQTIQSEQRIKTLIGVIKDENAQNKVKVQAYKELQKSLPELANLTYQQAVNQGILNSAIERELTLISKRAELKAYEEIYTQQLKDEYEQQEEILKGKRLVIALEAERIRGQALQRGSTIQQAQEEADLYKQRQLAALGEFNVKDKITELTTEILGLEGDRAAVGAGITAQADAQKAALERFNALLREQVDLQSILNGELQTYAKETFQIETEIEKIAEGIIDAQKSLIDERRKYFGGTFRQLDDELTQLFIDIVPDSEQRKKLVDAFTTAFQRVDEIIQDKGEAFKGGWDDIVKAITGDDGLIRINDSLKVTQEEFSKLVPEESKQDLVNYFTAFRGFTETIQKAQDGNVKAEKNRLFYLEKSLNIQEEIQSLQLYARNELNAELKNGQSRLETNEKLRQKILELLQLQQQITDLSTIDEKKQPELYAQAKARNEEIEKFVAIIQEGVINQGAFILGMERANERVTELAKTIDEGVVKQMEQLNNQSLPLFQEKLKQIVQTDAKALGDIFNVLLKNIDRLRDTVGEAGILELIKSVEEGINDNKTLTKEQLQDYLKTITIFRASFEEQVGGSTEVFDNLIDDVTKKLKKLAQEDFLATFIAVVNEFKNQLSKLSSLSREAFSFQLEVLENDYSTAMEGIVGDTKQANDKRVELEKAYQVEKAKIEKNARIKNLQFTLLQTVADTAASIAAALKVPPPAGQIIAGINGVIGAAQIALISQQIAFAKTLRRGGLLSSGGFISGPSHEQGGVYAGGGYVLEGNEAVINRQSAIQYSSLLSTINQSGGGRPIVVNNAMDSRLIEALAKQRTEPIRAYVIEQDITKAQAVNRRLDALATL